MRKLSMFNVIGLLTATVGAFLALYNVGAEGIAWFLSMCLYFVGCMMLFKRGK